MFKENIKEIKVNATGVKEVMSFNDYKNDDKYFVVLSVPLVAYLKMCKFSYVTHLDVKSKNVYYVFERSEDLKDAILNYNVGLFKVFAGSIADTKDEVIRTRELESIKQAQGLI